MKEFILTQPYSTIEEMVKSGEVAVYKEELEQGNINEYAIVSRMGNRYNIDGKKIEGFAKNPYIKKKELVVNDVKIETVKEEFVEETDMKYFEIEALIDEEIEKAVEEVNTKHAQELEALKETHAKELVNAKAEAKAELIAKLNA
jgi:hypothetical protein